MITRRLGAILAADVVGYSAMMERDEEGTAAQIRTLRREVIEPALNRHQGRLIKTTDDGQGTDLLERRVWDALSDRVIMASRRLVWPFRGIFLTRISPATMHRLPTVYPYRYFAEDGGLMSYGIDLVDQYRRAARYVHRIFHGEKPDELPVQAPAKFELVINHATAKAIGLSVPSSLMSRADEVIE